MIESWARQYDLQNKIRFNPRDTELRTEASAVVVYGWLIPNIVQDYRRFFHSYVGAVYYRNGMQEVQPWISYLINPTFDPSSIHSPSPGPPFPPVSPPPPMPPPPSGFHSSSQNASLITLALVNQTAVQKGCVIGYQAEQAGPPHQPTWTVVCLSQFSHFTVTFIDDFQLME